MGYLLIFVACFLNVVKAYSSKKLSKKTEHLADNIDLSILRNVFCVAIGALFILVTAGADFRLPPIGILICTLGGVAMSVNYIAWVMALKGDALVFVSVANNANFIVAAAAGVVIFDESLSWSKGVAIALILAAMLFMVKYQKGFGGMPRLYDFVLLLLVFLAGGMTSVTEKWFRTVLPSVNTHLYTFYAFLFSVVLLLVSRIFIKMPRSETACEHKAKLVGFTPYAAVMGIAVYGVTYFKTLANSYLDAVVLYPLNNGLTFVGSALMAWICFKEKPNKYSVIGMILVFAALILSSGAFEAMVSAIAS